MRQYSICSLPGARWFQYDVQIKPGIDEASAQKMLDDFWSLQYLIPAGVVTAFAGALRPAGVKDTDLKLTHAVHMRFSSMQVNL